MPSRSSPNSSTRSAPSSSRPDEHRPSHRPRAHPTWLLSMRAWLVALIVLATLGFVIGTSIERHSRTHESAAQVRAEGAAPKSTAPGESGESGESAATHAAETHSEAKTETHEELRPLGVNVEAVPFIVLAALASLALAALGWAR